MKILSFLYFLVYDLYLKVLTTFRVTMPRVLSHEMCRMRMCCCCGVKLKSPKSMSARLEELVKQWGPDPGFDSQISSYPTGICSTCQRDIYKVKQGKPEAATSLV